MSWKRQCPVVAQPEIAGTDLQHAAHGYAASERHRLPPYGLAVRRADRAEVRIYAGRGAWARGRWWAEAYPGGALVLPPEADAVEYSWPVTGRDVLLIAPGTPPDRLDELLRVLIGSGARRVVTATTPAGYGAGTRGPAELLIALPRGGHHG